MKKILVIVVIILLGGCDNLNKKYPTKLYGIEIFDNVNKYKIGDKDLTLEDFSKSEFNDTWYGYEKIKFNRSSNFVNYRVSINQNFEIVYISGGIPIREKRDNFKNKCVTKRDDFLKGVSKLYNFSFTNFKNKYFINNRGSSELKTSYTDRKYLIFKKNNKDIILASSCIYRHSGANVVQRFSYWIEEYDHTKERMLGYEMKETKKLKNEMIKFDFTGL